MPDESCAASTAYSEDEFELSLSGTSSVFGVGDGGGGDDDDGNDDTRPSTREGHKEEAEEGWEEEGQEDEGEQQGANERGGALVEPVTAVVVVSNENEGDDPCDHGATTDVSETAYSSLEEASLPLISPSLTGVGERDGRTTKQVCVRECVRVCADIQQLGVEHIDYSYSGTKIKKRS